MMDNLVHLLTKHLEENKLFGDVYTDEDVICIDISWGDWKHEHRRCAWLVTEFLSDNGYTTLLEAEIVTEDDGSDCYSATHKFFITKGGK